MSERLHRSRHDDIAHAEPLERRLFFKLDLSVVAVTPESPFFDQHSTEAPYGTFFNANVTVQNNGDTEVNYVGVTAGGSLILTRDRKLGNSDDITMTGSFVVTELPAKKQGNFKAGAFPLVTLDAGSYYLGTKFTAIDMMTNEIITQDFVTPKRVLQVVGTQLGSNSLDGTAGADSITFQSDGTNNYASLNGIWHTVPSGTTDLFVNAGTGDDTIVATSDFGVSLHVSGAGGNDTMIGGAAADELSGGNGYDKIYGGAGNDHLIGGANKDSLDGQAGNDTLSGGGGNDRLGDQFGNNYLIGGIGNDVFNVRNASADTVSGNTGEDQALLDANDYRSGIESLL